MALLIRWRSIRRCALLTVALLSVLGTGCAKHPAPVSPLVGRWQGTMADGNAAVPSAWEIRADGTQSLTLTLPQGTMTAQGTWTARGGILTQRTTSRVVVLGGEQKVVPLASPIQTMFAYQLQDDTLTLTQRGTQRQITLTRERGTTENRMP